MLQPTETPAETPSSSKKAKWRKLETIAEVRLALATVIKRTYDGKLSVERGSVCVAGLRVLAKTIYDSARIDEVEARLSKLEARTNQ